MNNLCDCCETAQGIERGQFLICDECNSDNTLFCKCENCDAEMEAGEMLYDDINGLRYCDDDCYHECHDEWPDDDNTFYGKGGDQNAWTVILINKRERVRRKET